MSIATTLISQAHVDETDRLKKQKEKLYKKETTGSKLSNALTK
jgi:hypothetical protein